ncbi:MAG: prepilin peptidase [Candidatus Magasanikbacteria bacterium]|nr:prepilin peptidase [Candidatus Magasanikbacteria bacterium]
MFELSDYTNHWGLQAYFLVFFFGLILGSFLNSIVWRLWDNIAIFSRSRSMCINCRQTLSWKENIPLLSWLILKGRCAHCKKDISTFYPLVELAVAASLTLIAYHYFPISNFSEWNLLRDFVFVAFLTVIFVQDLRYQVILSSVVWIGAVFGLVVNISFLHYDFNSLVFGALIGGGFFLAQYLLSEGRWIGGGDVRMGVMMGIWLGWQNTIVAIFLAYIIGAIFAVFLLITKKADRKTAIPFGTFLVVGTFLALYWGQSLVHWYTGLLR